jgi:hypothetical protein
LLGHPFPPAAITPLDQRCGCISERAHEIEHRNLAATFVPSVCPQQTGVKRAATARVPQGHPAPERPLTLARRFAADLSRADLLGIEPAVERASVVGELPLHAEHAAAPRAWPNRDRS